MSKRLDYTATGQRMQEERESNPVALAKRELDQQYQALQANMRRLESYITSGMDARALVRFAMLDMSRNPKLRQSTQESIYLGLVACAVAGLEPGALKGEAFLVPFFNGRANALEATFIAGWKGLVKQARRSREVAAINAQVVRDLDIFEPDLGSGLPPRHVPHLRGPRGDIIAAYATAKLISHSGAVSYEVELMDREDLDKLKERALAKAKGRPSDAWADWEDQMHRKAPIRRLCKRLPMGHDYFAALAIEDASESGQSAREVIDTLTDGEGTRAATASAAADSMRAQAGNGDERVITDEEAAEIARLERERAE